MKKIGMLITSVVMSLGVYSQTTQTQPGKQAEDQQRRADAGKADAIIARKKNIYDSTSLKKESFKTSSNKRVKATNKFVRPGRTSATKKKA